MRRAGFCVFVARSAIRLKDDRAVKTKSKIPVAATNAKRRAPPAQRLLFRADILAMTGFSYATLWNWMRDGKFPRSRVAGKGYKTVWLASEVEEWMAGLPTRPLKGDDAEAAA